MRSLHAAPGGIEVAHDAEIAARFIVVARRNDVLGVEVEPEVDDSLVPAGLRVVVAALGEVHLGPSCPGARSEQRLDVGAPRLENGRRFHGQLIADRRRTEPSGEYVRILLRRRVEGVGGSLKPVVPVIRRKDVVDLRLV